MASTYTTINVYMFLHINTHTQKNKHTHRRGEEGETVDKEEVGLILILLWVLAKEIYERIAFNWGS